MWKHQNTDELYHHGILGMKWGVRRYQNKDGSLTPKGKKRYANMSDDAKEASKIKKKKVSEMSNAELRKLTERQNLEQNYRRLNPSTMRQVAAIAGTTAAALGTINGLAKNGKKIVKVGKTVVDAYRSK